MNEENFKYELEQLQIFRNSEELLYLSSKNSEGKRIKLYCLLNGNFKLYIGNKYFIFSDIKTVLEAYISAGGYIPKEKYNV